MKRWMTFLTLTLGCLAPNLAPGAPAGRSGAPAEPQPAVRMPEVKEEFALFGTAFYVNDARGRDSVTFTSEAPLEDIVGTSNQIKGYVVFDPQNPEKGGRGEFVVPVASLETGIPMRDQHLQGAQWLNAEANPLLRFTIEDVREIKLVKEEEGFKTYEATLVGPFTLNGQSKKIEAKAGISYMPASEKTAQRLPGNLLVGRATFSLPLADFGIQNAQVIGVKVGDTIQVETRFVGTDQKPAEGGERARQGGAAPPGRGN